MAKPINIFLDKARSERLAVKEILSQAEKADFRPLYDCKELKPGDKVYWNQKGKSLHPGCHRQRTGA